jgi:hypothetical protein
MLEMSPWRPVRTVPRGIIATTGALHLERVVGYECV